MLSADGEKNWVDFETMRARDSDENLFLARVTLEPSGEVQWLYYITDANWQDKPVELGLWLCLSHRDTAHIESDYKDWMDSKIFNILEKQ